MEIEVIQIGLIAAGVLILFGDKILALNKANFTSPHKEAEESISELINQAQFASVGLNESLLERKSELEVLLKRLELKERALLDKEHLASQPVAQPQPEPSSVLDEFPNESWLTPTPKVDEFERRDTVNVKSDEKIAASMGFELAAIKVARRLLLAGQEDFKVAKKLGMSVNDIKQLKAMIGIRPEPVAPPVPKQDAIKKYNFNFEEAVNG